MAKDKIQQTPMLKKRHGSLEQITLFNGREVAEGFWGTLPYDSLFVYLFRRFGPPMVGSDDYKDLCRYLLTTNDKEVFVSVRLASYGFIMISPFVSQSLAQSARDEFFQSQYGAGEHHNAEKNPVTNRAYKAFEWFCNQLLLPVGIRDTQLNCLGEYTGKKKSVEPFIYAGYGVRVNEPDAKLILETK